MKYLLIALGLVFVAGCSQGSEDTAPVSFGQAEAYPMGYIPAPPGSPLQRYGQPGYRDDPEYVAAETAMFNEADRILKPALAAIRSGAPLDDVLDAARPVLAAQASQEVRWAVVSTLGPELLVLLLKEPSPEPSDVALVTEAMVETRNPNADLIQAGLVRSGSAFSDRERTQLAARAVDAAVEYVSRPCARCEAAAEDVGADLGGRRAPIQAAVRQLQADSDA